MFPFTGTPVADLSWPTATIGSTAADESGILNGPWNGYQRWRTDRLMVIDGARLGASRALLVNLYRGDAVITGGRVYGDRAEVQAPPSLVDRPDARGFYTLSIDFRRVGPRGLGSGWGAVTQWHANLSGSPPVGLYCEYGKLRLMAKRQDGRGNYIGDVEIWSRPVAEVSGRILHLAVEVLWRPDGGEVAVWVDGAPQDVQGGGKRWVGRTLTPGASYVYMKVGAYAQRDTAADGGVELAFANVRAYRDVTFTTTPTTPTTPGRVMDLLAGASVQARAAASAAASAMDAVRLATTAATKANNAAALADERVTEAMDLLRQEG